MKDGNKTKSDEFWDIEKIMPPKKRSRFSYDTDAVDVDLSNGKYTEKKYGDRVVAVSRDEVSKDDNKKMNFNEDIEIGNKAESEKGEETEQEQPKVRHYMAGETIKNYVGLKIPKKETVNDHAPKPIASYDLDLPLVKHIDVWQWKNTFHYYDGFKKDAVRYHNVIGKECEFADYISYMPQYSGMNEHQSAYYFWWRENIRHGKCIKTTNSYIILYFCEIINLPELVEPRLGSLLMCILWFGYRDTFESLDRFGADMLCDYCLVNNIMPPERAAAKLTKYGTRASYLPEFYVSFDIKNAEATTDAVVRISSNYNYRISRYYNDDTAELYEKYMPKALTAAFKAMSDSDNRFGAGMLVKSKLTSDAFSGSLCSYSNKRRLDIVYYSCSRSQKYRMIVTAMVKYCENYIRKILGVKSRFGAVEIPVAAQTAIDGYFAPIVSSFRRERRIFKQTSNEIDIPEYEKLYDAPQSEISADEARKIETESWEITDRLVDMYEDIEESDVLEEAVKPSEASEKAETNTEDKKTNKSGNDMLRDTARALLDGDNEKLSKIAKENNIMTDTLVEMLNNRFYDIIGDVIAEPYDNGYKLIEDYRNEAEEFADG